MRCTSLSRAEVEALVALAVHAFDDADWHGGDQQLGPAPGDQGTWRQQSESQQESKQLA
jgi:hypothetical protein